LLQLWKKKLWPVTLCKAFTIWALLPSLYDEDVAYLTRLCQWLHERTSTGPYF
jgi:hypothetical protein